MMISFIEKHFEGLIVAAFALFLAVAAFAWIQEHDARIIAEQTIKVAQTQIDSLQKQEAAVTRAGDVAITALQKQVATVRTPAQALQAIPALTDVPLNVRAAPGLPDAVTVDALPLFTELNQCKQTAVGLGVCTTRLDLEQKIDAEKDVQISALKKKPAFWKRIQTTAEVLAIGAVIGYAAHR